MYKWSWSHKIAAGSAKCSSECMKCVTTSPPWPVPQLWLFTASATKPTNILGSSIWLLGSETKKEHFKILGRFWTTGSNIWQSEYCGFVGKLQTAAIKRQKSKNMHLLQCSALVVSSFIPQIFVLLYDISRVHVPRGGHVFSSDCRKLNSKFKNSNSSAHVAMWFARTAAPMCQHVHR